MCAFKIIGLNLLVSGYILMTFVSSCHATNLALGKKYTLSVKPNYPLTAPVTDTTSLTDGVFTTGHFWTNTIISSRRWEAWRMGNQD